MKTELIRRSVMIIACLAVVGMLTGCDQAEQALEKTDLGATTEATKLITKATAALGNITDIESAKAALPALKDVDVDLGQLVQKVKEMSLEQKSTVTSAVAKVMPSLNEAITKVSSLAGVGDIVRPTLDSLQNTLKSIL